MLVERELVIRSFVAEDYLEVVASFRPAGHKSGNTYSGTWFRTQPEEAADKESQQKAMRLSVDGEDASRIIERARGKAAKSLRRGRSYRRILSRASRRT
jgi:DNA topoisomerase-3